MRKIPAVIFTACSLLLPPVHADPTGTPTVDDAGRFVATFPGPVTHNTKAASGDNTIYNTVFDNGIATYMVSYLDLPESYMSTHSMGEKYQSTLDGLMKRPNAVLVSQGVCALGSQQGQEYIVSYPDLHLTVHYRLFVINDRFYQVGFVGPTGSESSDTVETFLNSFRLLQQ